MWPERPNMKSRLNNIPANYYGLINGNYLSVTGILQFGITRLNRFLCIFNHIFTVSKFGSILRPSISLHFIWFSFNLSNTNLVRSKRQTCKGLYVLITV